MPLTNIFALRYFLIFYWVLFVIFFAHISLPIVLYQDDKCMCISVQACLVSQQLLKARSISAWLAFLATIRM